MQGDADLQPLFGLIACTVRRPRLGEELESPGLGAEQPCGGSWAATSSTSSGFPPHRLHRAIQRAGKLGEMPRERTFRRSALLILIDPCYPHWRYRDEHGGSCHRLARCEQNREPRTSRRRGQCCLRPLIALWLWLLAIQNIRQ